MTQREGEPTAGKYRRLGRGWSLVVVLWVAGILLAVNETFQLGIVYHMTSYYYGLLALFLSSAFLIFPASKGASRDKVPWYDILLFLVTIGCSIYIMDNAFRISDEAWVYTGSPLFTVVSVCCWVVVLEALRRAGGLPLFLFATFFSLYGLFAGHMPGFMKGFQCSFVEAARYHAVSVDSIIGIPTRVFCNMLIGFMVFGVALVATGGAKFFINFSLALLGAVRGGPAKVAVLASALFGSLSGSVLSNVVTTGSFTIPAMKRAGYPPYYAAAVEACASSGGCIMPPVMGAVAFIMASFLVVPYHQIIVVAAVPALLYFWGIFIQIDGFAATTGLVGLPRSELPSVRETLKTGWIYIFGLVALVYMLFVLQREAQAPYYATIMLLAGAMLRKETRLNLKGFLNFIRDSGQLLVEILAILAGVGLILGGLSMTGVAFAFSSELVHAVGGNVMALLMIGALTSFILGMGMTISACYIFLALVLVPALTPLGLNVFAVHLFVLYWGLVSFITPPVALGAYAAAALAGSNPIKTGFQAMRLGFSIYLVPFFFVFDPCLILKGPPLMILQSVTTAFLGLALIASAIEGYLFAVGRLGILQRVLCFGGGVVLCLAGWLPDLIGIALLAIVAAIGLLGRKSRSASGQNVL